MSEPSDTRPTDEPAPTPLDRRHPIVLLSAVCVAAACAIVYELIIASMSSYLLGNSIYQFSITIGLFMTSMGLGSFLSKYVLRRLIDRFVLVEVGIGVLGGMSPTLLFAVYVAVSETLVYSIVMYGLIVAIGTLVGLEIPILTRMITEFASLRVTLANVLTFDYVGALAGSIAFPLLLVKYLGLIETGFVVGFLNVVVGGILLVQYRSAVGRRLDLAATVIVAAAALGVCSAFADAIGARLESKYYGDQVVLEHQSPYQRIVITRAGQTWPHSDQPTPRLSLAKRGDDLRLYLDGQLQFSSVDEYRYHEALVHPAMAAASTRSDVLILGGGDGLAAREVLKYPDVQRIVLVDIDEAMTDLCSTNPEIVALNQGSLADARVTLAHQDGFKFVRDTPQAFDVVIVDLPDPNDATLSKLYSVEFYTVASRALRPGGVLVTQSTSPYFARAAFWCVHRSMEAAGLRAIAYHLDVPSMGDWGFNLGSKEPVDLTATSLTVRTLYLTPDLVTAMLGFGRDSDEIEVRTNTLLRPVLVGYYGDARWGYY